MSDHTGLFQQVDITLGTGKLALGFRLVTKGHETGLAVVKLKLQVLSETGRVVVTASLGVTKGFEQRVGVDNLLDDRVQGITNGRGRTRLHRSHVVHADLDSFGLSSSRFTGHEDGLIVSVKGKTLVGKSRNFVDVRLQTFTRIALPLSFPHKLVGVVDALLFGVQLGEPLEGVNSDNDIPSTSVRLASLVAALEVVKDTSLEGQSEQMEPGGFFIVERTSCR